MEMDALVNVIMAAGTGTIGSGLIASILKSYFTKSVAKIEEISRDLVEIKQELSGINVKLEIQEKTHLLTMQHESKIAVLESHMKHKVKA